MFFVVITDFAKMRVKTASLASIIALRKIIRINLRIYKIVKNKSENII
jgi:hypothetical protein